ncbi:putative colanic acid biosynthesis acetyltransferase [Rhabdobacter roseus]|uniref:Putative colanic acid biosynthesis acetyltransferase WcaF n=1 Tax=Rhabdobacter roseus TaxID=1655419 RepID=A0A840TJB4_9BACT|nr:WcaF family extracellular polysaccharide biosynthesis acetyltransferase [Rhabdobacter roseus]MBB5283491.1 putative colanic acid biosynthesis acetyltransferase WcaF [Rhabdobacter roseus]
MEKTFGIQTDLSKYDNRWYQPGSAPKRFLWFIIGRLFVNTYLPIPVSWKVTILRLFGAKIGPNVMLKPRVNIKYPWFLRVEENTWIGENVWIDNLTFVTLGKNVCLSQGAMLLTGNHDYTRSTFDLVVKPIVLHDGVWIGAQATICPGITAYSHAVLTVKSVATSDLEEYSIYRGNPARLIKKRELTQ